MPHFRTPLFGAFEEDSNPPQAAPPSSHSVLATLADERVSIPRSTPPEPEPPAVESTCSTEEEAEAQRDRQIRVKNRRKFYLDTHPDYFSSDLELADPLLYDRLVRRFQSAAEREEEGRKKGFSGVLEADIVRSEAKVEALANPDSNTLFAYKRGPNGEILAEEKDEVPISKEDAYAQWKDIMEWRFLSGEDKGFDYADVDDNEKMDDKRQMERDEEDAYFDSEEPSWGSENGVELQGETGIQDF